MSGPLRSCRTCRGMLGLNVRMLVAGAIVAAAAVVAHIVLTVRG